MATPDLTREPLEFEGKRMVSQVWHHSWFPTDDALIAYLARLSSSGRFRLLSARLVGERWQMTAEVMR
jgi:hypothetical protein